MTAILLWTLHAFPWLYLGLFIAAVTFAIELHRTEQADRERELDSEIRNAVLWGQRLLERDRAAKGGSA